jgi:ATP-binding protein involved in chromosome partitioning
MEVRPQAIRRIAGEGVEVQWSDSVTHLLTNELLRRQCPCAECRELRGEGAGHARPLTPVSVEKKGKSSLLRVVEHEKQEELQLERIWGVGNYAIGMVWGDGHDSGIYTYYYLRELGEEMLPRSGDDGPRACGV